MSKHVDIRDARLALGMTQRELAEAVGLSRQTVNAIERGEHNTTIKQCRAICRVLGRSLDELFGEAGEERAAEPVLLTVLDVVESTLLAGMLQEAGIPFLKKGVLGAGFVMRAGPQLERYAFYVPEDRLPRARQCLEDLLAPADPPGADVPGKP